MTEIAFARAFLATLDSRPIKVSADHVEDPKNYPARGPYVLHKMAKPMSKPTVVVPGQERSITVTLRSVRNPPLDIKLTSQLPTTSVLEIKSSVAQKAGIPTAKIKLLHKKKPVVDSKALKDLVADDGPAEVEFSVMVLGGAAAVPSVPSDPGPKSEVALKEDEPAVSGAAALDTSEFWADLKSFLTLRLRDEQAAETTADLFRTAWNAKSS